MAGTRNALTFAVLTCALLVATTACTSSGNPAHDGTSPSSDSPTQTVSSTSSSASPSPSWTPPNYGTAKPAVDAYLAFMAATDKAFRDPTHVRSSTFDKYVAGQAKLLFDSSLAQERRQGKAQRGAAPIRHVRVVKNRVADKTLPWVVLRDCATTDPKNPYVEYYVETGKPVPQKSHNPPGPYADTIKIFLINGQWTITSFTVDTTWTCKP
ncbi:MAG TPA: hypothetical protein VE441_11730 [Mycobacterium sp.]|jgi:hypothetical protein|nr:hypothetical protein [Mycobacterium sp.]